MVTHRELKSNILEQILVWQIGVDTYRIWLEDKARSPWHRWACVMNFRFKLVLLPL